MRYRFYTCDVFTDTRFGGNPLAVFPDATGLSAEQMQKIAREINYSESTFVFPAEHGHTRKVRIFTPMTEVPFAGHPNVGTAFVLASIGELGEFDSSLEIVFEEAAGLVPILIRKEPGRPVWCELKAPEQVFIGRMISAEKAAAALSLTVDEIVTTHHRPQVASVGLPFLIVELRDMAALERAQANIAKLRELRGVGITPDVHLYIRTNADSEYDLRTRMFAPLDNVPEDPATGSANCALVGMLTTLDPQPDGAFKWHIAQGFEMGRPSVLDARTEKRDGEVTGVWIAGHAVMVTDGYLEAG
ncbi:MAG: trans-2,3-dihydro-3-hydroxyanthranilate isomerase [Cellvibrionaceae bacterium]|jgi:trans-2,3-dihydro-3-hydroxyanthranilate isomerase